MADDIQPEVADDTADDIDETTQGDQAPSAGDDLPESGDTDAAATDEPVDPTADDSKADDDAGTDNSETNNSKANANNKTAAKTDHSKAKDSGSGRRTRRAARTRQSADTADRDSSKADDSTTTDSTASDDTGSDDSRTADSADSDTGAAEAEEVVMTDPADSDGTTAVAEIAVTDTADDNSAERDNGSKTADSTTTDSTITADDDSTADDSSTADDGDAGTDNDLSTADSAGSDDGPAAVAAVDVTDTADDSAERDNGSTTTDPATDDDTKTTDSKTIDDPTDTADDDSAERDNGSTTTDPATDGDTKTTDDLTDAADDSADSDRGSTTAESGTDDSDAEAAAVAAVDVTDAADDDSTATDDEADSDDGTIATAVLVTDAADTDDDTASPAELVAQLAELRAEYEVLQRQQEESEKPRRLHRPSRHWVSIACVVLGGLLLPLAVLVRWTSNTVLDTDSYVETVAPLAQNEDIQEALSFRVSVILLDAIDFQMLAEEALPPRAGFLAAPIESGVRVLVQDVVDGLVSTQAFERLWEDVNRVGHENVVAVLTGEGNDTLDTADGKVVVRLGPIAGEVLDRLDDILGTDLKNSIPDERLDGEFVLVESDELASLQDEISLFDRLSWLIPILTIALLAASVVISRPRRLAFRRLGIAIVAPMTISLLLYDWVRSQYVGALPDDVHNPDAAAAFFDITTRFVPRDMRVLLVVGVVILFLTWLFGPTGWAGRARVWWDTLVGRVGDKSEGRDVGVAPRWVADNKRTLLAFAVALGVLTLLVWTRPTGLVVLTVIVVVVLLMAVTSLVAEIGRRAERADTGGGTDAADASDAEPSIDAESAADAESSVSN